MPLLNQIKEILDLLVASKEEMQSWVDVNEEEILNIEDEDTKELIRTIESVLHEIGY